MRVDSLLLLDIQDLNILKLTDTSNSMLLFASLLFLKKCGLTPLAAYAYNNKIGECIVEDRTGIS